MSEVAVSSRVDRTLFSLHEEEDVVEVPPHRRQVVYFETNFRAELPERFIGANMAIYWGPCPGALVRIWTADGRMLLTPDEEQQHRLEAEERAQEERQRRVEAEQRAREAEAHAAELAAELERLRRGSG